MFWTALLFIWTASEIGINIATRTRRGQGIIEDRGSLLVLWIVIVSSVTACEVLRRTAIGALAGGSQLLATLGWVVLLLGLAIRWAAIFSLGKSFSANVAIQPTQTVYRGGLYSRIRHPSYLGLLLIFEGIGLHACNWIALLVAFIPPTAAVLYRIHVEEAALEKAFGEEYLAYERDTKRLIPGVY
jgi:protein-S-isoprenylcysteine O-methyltransferase Ste14